MDAIDFSALALTLLMVGLEGEYLLTAVPTGSNAASGRGPRRLREATQVFRVERLWIG